MNGADWVTGDEAEIVIDVASSLDIRSVAVSSDVPDALRTYDAMSRVSLNALERGLKFPDGRKHSVAGSALATFHIADSPRSMEVWTASDGPIESLAGTFTE